MSGVQPGGISDPLNVAIVSETSGTAVIQTKHVVALASAATDTHTYTAVGTVFNPSHIWATASGLIKIVVTISAVERFTGFNSTSSNNIDIDLSETLSVAIGDTVTVAVTNRELIAQDVYSTISGEQQAVV